MKSTVVVSLLLFLAVSYIAYSQYSVTKAGEYKVFFCPEDDCDQAVISQIRSAEKTVYAAVYSFTLDSIAGELIAAHERGVVVKVVIEEQQNSEYSQYKRLIENGIDVRLDKNSALMHNKFCVVDGKIVVTGSYNWSKQATESNDENLMVIYSENLAFEYAAEFNEIFSSAA